VSLGFNLLNLTVSKHLFVRVNTKHSMNRTREIKGQRQKDIKDCRDGLGTNKHADRRQHDGKEISHSRIVICGQPRVKNDI